MNKRPVTWPEWSLLGGRKYVPAHSTDLRELFRRIKAEQEAERIARERREAEEREP